MTVCICNGTGNFTGASTFASAEASSLAAARQGTVTTLANNAASTSSAFTIANAAVVDGVLLWVKQGAAGSTGTFKVDLQLSGVSKASVTVNRTDLPSTNNGATGCPVFFKFGSTATGDGTANWTLVLTNSNGTNTTVIAAATSTATNFTKILRTTSAHTAAAGDDFYICKELTGAGTSNARTVTMDNTTASTQFGGGTVNTTAAAGSGIYIGFGGTLSYGTSASTNYALKLAGDLAVYDGGTFNMGTSGTPIPASSTALLNLVPTSADTDFGVIANYNATVTTNGSSRTSAKNIVTCKLNADFTGACVTTGAVSTTNGSVSSNNALEWTGTSRQATTFTDNATASVTHFPSYTASASVSGNTTQVGVVWLARGTGTHNQFVRLIMGGSASAAPTNGFFADIDMSAGTIGTCTAIGNGTATSSSITAMAGGFLCTIIGKVSSATFTTSLCIVACSASGTVTYTGDTTQCFAYYAPMIITASSYTATTLTVDTDTGWLAGDVCAIASTSRTNFESEIFSLTSNATSTTLPLKQQLGTSFLSASHAAVNHSGTALPSGPGQAEIILLTRNVKIQSNSTTLTVYGYAHPLASVTCAWTEFWNMSSTTVTKNGAWYFDTTSSGSATAKSLTYCSFHDGHGQAVVYGNSSGSNSVNAITQNCTAWYVANNVGSQSSFLITGALALTDWTFDNITAILCSSATSSGAFVLGDVGGTFTNITIAGASAWGMNFSENAVPGTFGPYTCHSGGNGGITAGNLRGTISNVNIWRTSGIGISTTNIIDATISTGNIFGNALINIQFGNGASSSLRLDGVFLGGDTTFGITDNIKVGTGGVQIYMDSCDTTASGIKTAATNDFNQSLATAISGFIVARNSKFGATNLVDAKTSWSKDFFFATQKYGQVSGDHRCEMTYGQIKTDTSIFNTASPSERMTPISTTNKLESAPRNEGIQWPIKNGNTCTPTVMVRESVIGDGAAYNGNAPRLIVRANPAVGIAEDTVLATYSGAAGTFRSVSGATAAVTDDGVLEFIVDCDGTAGWINVDDWSFV